MKMTADVMKRCENMLCDFANKNRIDVGIEHAECRNIHYQVGRGS